MLQLTNIKKTYGNKENKVEALKGISLSFRKSEFVSILGPSGCGKTTMLNIIGGLDRYTEGDLSINGVSTKNYKDRDWDTYRNHSIGFVFQSYNLIPHQTILENVELTLSLGGVSSAERKKRALEALTEVGLAEKVNKKPNELSGGQMQRVSIARALVGNPDIILADEPTGALDSETSVTVMELLKEISKTRLVIMVTHNPELAEKYSDRIVRMLDGKVVEDTDPFEEEALSSQGKKEKQSSMSFFTALYLSAKNLLSKKRRTFITSLASSIGLIGIAVILSVSNGMQTYIDNMMLDNSTFNYISIRSSSITYVGGSEHRDEVFPENTTGVTAYTQGSIQQIRKELPTEFLEFLHTTIEPKTLDIDYSYGFSLPILHKGETVTKVSASAWKQCMENTTYLAGKYDVLAGSGIPTEANQISLVVDNYNRVTTGTLNTLGFAVSAGEEVPYEDIIGREYRILFNDGWYEESEGIYKAPTADRYEEVYDNDGITVKIVSVLRAKDEDTSWLSSGITYSSALTDLILTKNQTSKVYLAQKESKEIDVTTGKTFNETFNKDYLSSLASLGSPSPENITIYPLDVNTKDEIVELLNEWNEAHEENKVSFTDMSNLISASLGTTVDIVTYVLVAFSSVSLVISSIMIAIIIYASVIERTKEIGVLRSIGARKKDVSRVFEAEAVILGLTSGIIAILITYGLDVIINGIIENLVEVSGIAVLSPLTAISLIGLSVFLLFIASLIPSSIASKKDPAIALRSE